MDIFEIIVGIFSIFSSIAAIISAIFVAKIKSDISTKGNNNSYNSTTQTNKGTGNTNVITSREI